MLTLPALKVQQFAQEFFLLNLAGADVERLIRFEVLGTAPVHGQKTRRGGASLVNWAEIERRVETSEKAYQRPILRKKIDELAAYYLQCRDDGAMPAIPGAVLLTTDEPISFTPEAGNPFVGLLQLSGEDGSLRVLDGQHRLLALTSLLHSPDSPETARASARLLQVPAILFASLPAPSVVQMFVTINSTHTRLNQSLLFTLKGRQLYSDPLDARIHDVINKLNTAGASPLQGKVKMLGVGPGKVAQAGIAQEMRKTIDALRAEPGNASWIEEFLDHADRFYLAYFKEVAKVFAGAWDSKRHSIISLQALRAFIRASGQVASAVWRVGGDPRVVIRASLAPWADRIGDGRFETAGLWRERAAGGGKEATRTLGRELVAALGELP